jgi:hypothetical protein
MRQAAMNTEGGIHGPDRLAGLGRIDRHGIPLGDFPGCVSD